MISHEILDDDLLRLAGKKCASGTGHLYEVGGFFAAKGWVYKRPDHPSGCNWLGSPPFISHETPIWKGKESLLRGRKLTMVINHLLTGMILQVGSIPFPIE